MESVVIDIKDDKLVEKRFDELFEVESVIELKFKEDFYLADLYRVVVTEEAIYALDPNFGNLIRFSPEGKVLNKIGPRGDGPAEMPEIVDFAYDGEKDELILGSYSAMKLSRFKPTGEFVSSFKIGEQLDQLAFFPGKDGGVHDLLQFRLPESGTAGCPGRHTWDLFSFSKRYVSHYAEVYFGPSDE